MSRIDDYIAVNEKARALRERIMRALAADSDALKDVTLAELDRIIRDNPGLTPEEYSSIIARDFQLSASKTKTLKARLEEGQLRMAAMRTEMMESLAGAAISMNAEQLASAYRVNFPKISNDINRMVQTAMRQIINRKGDIGELQSMLEDTEIGAHQAKTLANTALAQYDNHYTIALARQAGIARFEYHGPPAQRAFCRARVGNVYTLDEMRRMNNGQGLDVLTSCGGYNCRHQWLPVPDTKRPVRDESEAEDAVSRVHLGDREREAVDDYTERGTKINKAFRMGTPSNEDIRTRDGIRRAMLMLPMFQGTTYRGVSFASRGEFERFASGLDVGEAAFREFTSSSLSFDKAAEYLNAKKQPHRIMMEIQSRRGSYIGSLSKARGNEKEVLHDMETTFKVRRVQHADHAYYYILEEQWG